MAMAPGRSAILAAPDWTLLLMRGPGLLCWVAAMSVVEIPEGQKMDVGSASGQRHSSVNATNMLANMVT